MSEDIAKNLPECDTSGLNFNETELTLGLPGDPIKQKSGVKRRLCAAMELNHGGSSAGGDLHDDHKNCRYDESDNEVSSEAKSPIKTQVVGWPPVRSYRKNMMKSSKYVKVAVDGAPYLRKVDLETYGSYQDLLNALENMFTCFTICHVMKKRKFMDPGNGIKYVPTYEDKDGDWMLVGDVPWKMFVESCKRLRLMKISEAIGLVPKTPSRILRTSC